MSNSFSRRFRFAIISVSVWVTAFLLFYYFRHTGIEEFMYVEVVADPEHLKFLGI